MPSEGVGLHVVLWLHQYAVFWLPLVTLLLLGGLGWVTVHLVRKLLRCGDRREAVHRWCRELGGPVLVTGVGLLLLVSPGWSWPDVQNTRADSFFHTFSYSPGTPQPDVRAVPSVLPAWEDMTVEGLALADMMKHSGELTLLWCGLELALVAVMFGVLVPTASRRRRWLFHRPSAAWRLFHCDLPPTIVAGVVGLGLVPGLVVSEWLRGITPSWPGMVLQAGILMCGTGLLICVVRRSGVRWGCRALMVVPASLMLLRLIWILT